jgi:NTE family protein
MKALRRKTVGLALGSGGWRGLAHLGVIKELEKEGIPIDFIAGSSAGALIGGLYSFFGGTREIEDINRKLSYRSLYGIILDPVRGPGLIGGRKYLDFLEKRIGDARIEDLKIKFTAVCSDLLEGDAIGIASGKLSTAIRASSSIPLVFKPAIINGRLLVDGGNTMPVPVKIVKEMGADIIVAVNVYNNIFPFKNEFVKGEKLTYMDITKISYQMMLAELARENVKEADFVINPKIVEGNFSLFKKFVNNPEAIEDGARSARDIIPLLKEKIYEPS